MAKQEKLDLKTPDAFHTLSDRMFHWIEEHAKTVISAVAGAVAVALVLIGYNAYQSRRETRAAEALFGAESALKKAEITSREVREKRDTALPVKGEKKIAPPAVKPFEDEFGPLVGALEVKIKENASTSVALVSAMNLAYFLISEKQPGRALAILDQVTYRPRASDILAGFLGMHRGLALIETGKFKEATSAYQAVVDQKALAPLHAEATLKLAFARELAGEGDAAREGYEKVTRDFPGSEAAQTAQNFLRALSLKDRKG